MIIYNQTLKMSAKNNYEVRNISYAVFYRFIYILINLTTHVVCGVYTQAALFNK